MLTLDGRDHLADRLSDEVDWLRQCAGSLRQLAGGGYPPVVNLRPPPTGRTGPSWPSTSRVAAVIDRIAADVDGSPGPAGPVPRHRRGAARQAGGTPSAAAEQDLEFRAFCARGCGSRVGVP